MITPKMRILGICWTQGRDLVLLLALMGAPSAAEVWRLVCNVSSLPGGLFQYLLSPELGPECEEQGWEDRDKTALTRGSDFDLDLVHSVTNQSLVLRQCYNYTRFTGQCPGFTEADCYFNCNSVTKVPDIVIPSNMLLLVLMVAPVSSEALRLQCEVSALAGKLFRYQIRPKAGLDSLPLPKDCLQRGWLDVHKNVLTLDSDVDVKRVKNVTDWTVDLKECLDYARFTAQCPDYMEVICKTNCSSVSQPFLTDPPNMDPSTKSCDPPCVDWNTVIAVSVVAAVVVLIATGLLVWKLLIPRFRRKKERYIQGQPEERNLEDPENPIGH